MPADTGGAADPDALGDASTSAVARCCWRSLGRFVHTTQHFHLQTSRVVARQNSQPSTSATCQNNRNQSACGKYVFFL